MRDRHNILSLNTVLGHRATIVEASMFYVDENNKLVRVFTTGEAVRHPDDKHDRNLGVLLAQARALENLSSKLLKRANGRVKSIDDNRRRSTQTVDEPRWVTHKTNGSPRCQGVAISTGRQCKLEATDENGNCHYHLGQW